MIAFKVYLKKLRSSLSIPIICPVIDERYVRNLGGQKELRPAMKTLLVMCEASWGNRNNFYQPKINEIPNAVRARSVIKTLSN